jgi:hypothetical protein
MKSPFLDDAVDDDRAIKDLLVDCKCPGSVVWFQIPDTEWKPAETKKQIDDATAWFKKYCIPLTFEEFVFDRTKDQAETKKWDKDLKGYHDQMILIPAGKIAKENDLIDLQDLVLDIFGAIQKRSATGKKVTDVKLVVLFLDDWYVSTGELGGERRYRVSATATHEFLIGLTRYDRTSTNMLTHELIHALRKDFDKGRDAKCMKKFIADNKVTIKEPVPWERHYGGKNKEKVMNFISRTDPYLPDSLASDNVLTVREYLTILDGGYLACVPGCQAEDSKTPAQPPKQNTPKNK